MKTKEIELSFGKCVIREMKSREAKLHQVRSARIISEINEKIELTRINSQKKKLQEKKDEMITDLYYEFIANAILEHNFNLNGKPLPEFLGEQSDSEIKIIETTIDELSKVSSEEKQDLSVQSGQEKSENASS